MTTEQKTEIELKVGEVATCSCGQRWIELVEAELEHVKTRAIETRRAGFTDSSARFTAIAMYFEEWLLELREEARVAELEKARDDGK